MRVSPDETGSEPPPKAPTMTITGQSHTRSSPMNTERTIRPELWRGHLGDGRASAGPEASLRHIHEMRALEHRSLIDRDSIRLGRETDGGLESHQHLPSSAPSSSQSMS